MLGIPNGVTELYHPLHMAHLLWKLFWEKDVNGFCRLLIPGSSGPGDPSKTGFNDSYDPFLVSLSSTPPKSAKTRKFNGKQAVSFSKAELNIRDHAGLTLLHRAVSTDDVHAVKFVSALLGHPSIDLYVQDLENGWNALHRALYHGNIGIARLLLEKEQNMMRDDLLGIAGRTGQLIKTKDFEGNSPFDLYNWTIRSGINIEIGGKTSATDLPSDSESEDDLPDKSIVSSATNTGTEVYIFGSNKNNTLGVGDSNDRQFPERIQLQRPEELYEHFYQEWLGTQVYHWAREKPNAGIPRIIRSRPLVIKDVVLSKLHSAIITDDPFSNLYITGVGRGGRLGLGHENTQFRFVPVQHALADKHVKTIALGQNHTMAVTDSGELWTWGSNTCSQLGYTLPPPTKPDEEPMSLTPRQVFNILKKEVIIGVAASSLHSVAFTPSSLYVWGRNVGQLALMDADSRSLQTQVLPRKVAASMFTSPIIMASASDKATICLLKNHNVIVFTNYGYNIVRFPTIDIIAGFGVQATSNSRGHRGIASSTRITSISAGGDTIAALSDRGEAFIMNLQSSFEIEGTSVSTTNPAKMKSSVSAPQRVWHARKDEATSLAIGEGGSVILSTKSGAVWKRVRREKAKESKHISSDSASGKRNAFKFQRVPTITGAVAVRGSTHGAYLVIRAELPIYDWMVRVRPSELRQNYRHIFPLKNFHALTTSDAPSHTANTESRSQINGIGFLGDQIFTSLDFEADLKTYLDASSVDFEEFTYNVLLFTSSEPDIKVPAHTWILGARSTPLRTFFASDAQQEPEDMRPYVHIRRTERGFEMVFQQMDILGLVNLVSYLYTDTIVEFWNFTRYAPSHASRHRQVRVDLMKLASYLQMLPLEAAARSQNRLMQKLHLDLRDAISHRNLRFDGDVLLKLNGKNVLVHRDVVSHRCQFFYAIFKGYSHGAWLSRRYADLKSGDLISIDLSHMNPRHFEFVLEHIYADVGSEMFDNVVTSDLDTFGELVLGVMVIANELMLDRLVECCQKVLSRFVNMRNVAGILNEVNISYISSLKEACMSYIALQVEGFLENHLLSNMHFDLLLELDRAVQQRQRLMEPYSRSRNLESLYILYPDLPEDVAEERRIRVREMAWRHSLKNEKQKNKSRRESINVTPSAAISPFGRMRRKGKEVTTESISGDDELMFNMEVDPLSPTPKPCGGCGITADSSDLSGRKSGKKLTFRREPLALDGLIMMGSSQPPPAAPWSEFQPYQTSIVPLISENMTDAKLNDGSEWQNVSSPKTKKQIAISSLPVTHTPFISGSPVADRLLKPSPRSSTQTLRRVTSSAKPVTPSSSFPSRPLNLGSFIPTAGPVELKIKMTIPPPPTQPAAKLDDIFCEQLQEKETEKEIEQQRSRPLREIIEEEQFLQWWEEEQERMRAAEEDERKSMKLVCELMAQQNAMLSSDSSKPQSCNKGRGKVKSKAMAVDPMISLSYAVEAHGQHRNCGSPSSRQQGNGNKKSQGNSSGDITGNNKKGNPQAKNRRKPIIGVPNGKPAGPAGAGKSKEKNTSRSRNSGKKQNTNLQNKITGNGNNGQRRSGAIDIKEKTPAKGKQLNPLLAPWTPGGDRQFSQS